MGKAEEKSAGTVFDDTGASTGAVGTDGAAGTGEGAADHGAADAPAAGARRAEVAEKPKRTKESRSVPVKESIDKGRALVARVIWIFCLLAALALAIGALLIVLDANRDNSLVTFVLDVADWADLGIFDRNNGIKTFTGADAETKNVLVNWGIGALAWLIVGRIVERVVRP